MDPSFADLFWPALALVLVFEGLMPFVAPRVWRRMFTEMLKLQDGQIRFFGLICLGAGALVWWLVT
ncbi:DUF2065 domain-containing protein [Hydrogenophaga sp. RWCD_12]|uniref:DUF2065 domain-containing protein n=1 Tax=Hydrogenophaga sp. RWCD_12 TaxID=3391190 RepID=UPI003984B216